MKTAMSRRRSTNAASSAMLCRCLGLLLLVGLNMHVGVQAVQDAASDLVELNEETWEDMLQGEWMVEFFAPWCPACKSLAPTWERFAAAAAEINVNVAQIDVTTSPSLSGRFFVTALPTIYHVKDGEFRHYRGARDGDSLLNYVRNALWKKTEPLSAWKKPDTVHMSILSYFFKLSHTLKDLNTRLQQEYGMPTWGSYALFATATIFVGAALGLMLVCVVDFLYPPKKSQRQSFSETKENSAPEGVEDMINNDEIEDDAEQEYEDDVDEDEQEDEDEDEVDEEEQEQNDEEDEAAEDDASTSNEEKQSAESESEEPESEKHETKIKQTNEIKNNKSDEQIFSQKNKLPASSTSDVRKRKPRKAD